MFLLSDILFLIVCFLSFVTWWLATCIPYLSLKHSSWLNCYGNTKIIQMSWKRNQSHFYLHQWKCREFPCTASTFYGRNFQTEFTFKAHLCSFWRWRHNPEFTQGTIIPGQGDSWLFVCESISKSIFISISQSCASARLSDSRHNSLNSHKVTHVWKCSQNKVIDFFFLNKQTNKQTISFKLLKCFRKGETEVRSLSLSKQNSHWVQWPGCARTSEGSPTRKIHTQTRSMGRKSQMGTRVLQRDRRVRRFKGKVTYTGRKEKQEKEVGDKINPTRWLNRQKLRLSWNI